MRAVRPSRCAPVRIYPGGRPPCVSQLPSPARCSRPGRGTKRRVIRGGFVASQRSSPGGARSARLTAGHAATCHCPRRVARPARLRHACGIARSASQATDRVSRSVPCPAPRCGLCRSKFASNRQRPWGCRSLFGLPLHLRGLFASVFPAHFTWPATIAWPPRRR